jgi:hypothetical protein
MAEGELRLGKYQILKRLATGGMAEIFLARASGLPGFQRMVVIKRILPVLACKTDFLEMFLNEARIAATLQHPNVVQTYDVGVADGDYFIAMEYLHGEDVRALQAALHRNQERLPLEHALQIVIGVCAGLHYAHEKLGFDGQPLAIVHRDVSPQNVIVTFDGAVKLLDFGVAKAAISAHDTLRGVVKGKISYMSPEQCRGAPFDRRSDLFSLGIVLYELTLGRRLFGGGTEFETLKRIAEQPVVPPRAVDPDYDERLERIVIRALAKDPDRRYQTARELQLDLEDLARHRGLYLSAIALQQFMARVFGERREAWRDPPPPADDPEYSVELIVDRPAMPRRITGRWLALLLLACGPAAVTGLALRAQRAHHFKVAVAAGVPTPALAAQPALAPQPAVPQPAAASPAHAIAPSRTRAAPSRTTTAPARAAASPRASSRRAPVSAETATDGQLILAASPWCEVMVDGVPRGPTPSTLGLPVGLHRVRLSNPAFGIDSSFVVPIAPREVVRRSLSFPVTARLP